MSHNLQRRIKRRRPFESPHEEAYLNLLLTHSLLDAGVARCLKARRLTQPAYNVLRILSGDDPSLTCTEVRDRMVTRVPDVTRLIDRLVTCGYVTRKRSSADRRVVMVAITPAGRQAIAGLDRQLIDLHERQLAPLSPDELAQLTDALTRVRAGLASHA